MRWLVRVGVILLILVLAGGYFAAISIVSLYEPVDPASSKKLKVTIPTGSSTEDIGLILKEQGLIKNETMFRLLARWYGKDSQLKAGEYELTPAMSLAEVLEKIAQGKVTTRSFTVPEGYAVEDIIRLLDSKGFASERDLRQALKDTSLLEKFGWGGALQGAQPFEGYLFPDTYRVETGTPPRELVNIMLKRMFEVWSPELQGRAEEMGLNIHQVLTLASIVEKEAKVDSERPIIAGVYWNRFKKGMKLDADPTVRYALGKFKEPLTYADLKVDSPYNTYRNTGLPPGPIASPGLKSILAVLHPDDVPYFYFVAREDGTHIFSRTLKEQNQNIAKLRRSK